MRKVNFGFAAFVLLSIVLISFSFPTFVLSQFATQRGWGGTSAGTANAQTVAVPNYNLDVGVPITFVVGVGNSDATTLNINATGAINVKRATSVGADNFVGGEFTVGSLVTVVYDGTQYRLQGEVVQIAAAVNFRGGVPVGYVPEDGRCFTTTQYPAIFSVIGLTYGNCGAGTFAIPDSRGRADFSLDNIGTGPASRITNCSWVALGGICGNQNTSLTATNQLPSTYAPSGTISSITPTGTITTTLSSLSNGVLNNQGVGGGANVTGGGGTYTIGVLTASSTFAGNAVTP